MQFLLDTHIVLWWLADDPRLKQTIRKKIQSPHNILFVSAASAWEISIKKSLGKLKAPGNIEEVIYKNGFNALPIDVNHVEKAGKLTRHHDDPFDRVLVAQAKIENLTIITRDKKLMQYSVSLLMA